MTKFFQSIQMKFYHSETHPTIGFAKISFLIIFSMILFAFVKEYTAWEIINVIAGAHVLTAGALLLLKKHFKKSVLEIIAGTILPLHTISWVLTAREF